MLEFIKHWLFACLILFGLAGCLTGCSSEDVWDGPVDSDELPGYFGLFQNAILFSQQESQLVVTAHGVKGEDGIGVIYISPRRITNWEDDFNFIGDDPVFDVSAYCSENGYDSYPNTSDFFVHYKWLEINTVKSPDEPDGKITVKVEANPFKESRSVWILLRNQKTDVLEVHQEGNPNGVE